MTNTTQHNTAWRGKLFGHHADAKTSKPITDPATGRPYRVAINYGASGDPFFCPNAGPDRAACAAGCLRFSGRGKMKSVEASRQAKNEWFLRDPAGFMEAASADVKRFTKWAERRGGIPAIRFNGTWDRPDLVARYLAPKHPNVVFYDYVKSVALARQYALGYLPPNYHLTLSWSGATETYRRSVEETAAKFPTLNIAVVFGTKEIRDGWIKTGRLFLGRPVIDGTAHDVRLPSLDGRGVIVGLVATGEAIDDETGFVTRRLPIYHNYPHPTPPPEITAKRWLEMDGVTYYA